MEWRKKVFLLNNESYPNALGETKQDVKRDVLDELCNVDEWKEASINIFID